MCGTFGCRCEERKKPVEERNWEVTQYRCNHSAFNGYHQTASAYSTVKCHTCGEIGRTKASYVIKIRGPFRKGEWEKGSLL